MKASISVAREPDLLKKRTGRKPPTYEIERGSFNRGIRPVKNRKEEIVSLELKATRSRNPGTGERGGEFRAYDYKFMLELEPKDVEEIITAAVKHGLISVQFKPKNIR